ncbi:hypothetical protein TH66_21500 [Carbonactinospora thermoautotrophica]|uniref:DUF1232 domain-containing protein n=1 Tax=Carbonactinospora thermoautotrophica TaxID=1469144 RepID=A0A132MJJ5_9ACTN|nr:YkvA family protein [Carbonactinospora thermoautotrophica]KWW97943.1 hypothetical protein TH66_21500 [Carbonactinospora thermoautotrophica]KWX09644.1 hypothetical protein TR74_08340 [Carbonactinospora thermoautotrophica]
MKRRRALFALARVFHGSRRPGAPGLGARLAAIPRLVRATLRREYGGLSRARLVLLALGLGYLVSPVDLAPEALFAVFGLADDAILAVWLAGSVLDETERFLAWETSRRRLVPLQSV